MTVTVTVTITPEASRNSFLSVAEADALVLPIYGTTADSWRALTGDSGTDTKGRLLVTATRQVSAGAVWDGSKNDLTTPFEWPRSRPYPYEVQSGDTGIPAEVQRATVWQALYLLGGRIKDAEAQRDGIRSASTGGVSASYIGRDSLLCPEALDELKYWRVMGADIA